MAAKLTKKELQHLHETILQRVQHHQTNQDNLQGIL